MPDLTSLVNTAGDIYKAVADLSPKQFYSLRDFYHFIRSTDSYPLAWRHFTIVPVLEQTNLAGERPREWHTLFSEGNLARFAICSSINSMPPMKFNTSTLTLKTPYGDWTGLQENTNIFGSGSFTMTITEISTPIIQSFIIPWMYQMVRSRMQRASEKEQKPKDLTAALSNLVDTFKNGTAKLSKNYAQFGGPKMRMDVKFYRPDEIAGLEFLMNPSFVYRFRGCWPSSATLVNAAHGTGNRELTRTVTFQYDSFAVFPDPDWEKKLTGVRTGFAYDGSGPVRLINQAKSLYNGAKGVIKSAKSLF